MEKTKPKIEYEIDEVQGTIRVRFAFDTGEDSSLLGQLNFPIGTEEQVIKDTLKDMYYKVQERKQKPPLTGKRVLDW